MALNTEAGWLRRIMATAQQLIARGFAGGSPSSAKLKSVRVGGSTTTHSASPTRGAASRIAGESFICQARARALLGDAAMTDRIKDFLARNRGDDGPRLVVDLDVVRENYLGFASALPDTRVFYALKANPAPEILSLLASLGSCFDAASIAEIEHALTAGATPERISFGNTIKKEKDIVRAFAFGVRLFAVDCEAEVEKVARAAPGSKVFCRILCDGAGAEWPLSRKFGCAPEMAAGVLERAHALGLVAHGLSFHVGSQQGNPRMWDRALKTSASIFRDLAERGVQLSMINLGGGFPTRYTKDVPGVRTYGQTIFRALRRHFGNRIPETIIEPGRGMVGNAGIIEAEVVLISRKSVDDRHRWVYLDIGKFNGLAETTDEMIRYPIRTDRDDDALGPCVLAGPSCDSIDVLYEKDPYFLPVTLEIGAKVLIEGTGAYTTTYSSVGFNGFAPLKSYVI
jgi:ornithine decarboxylase